MRNSSLRGFSASARSYLTVLLNLIRGNPDVLVKKNQGSFDNKAPEDSFPPKSICSVLIRIQMFTGAIR